MSLLKLTDIGKIYVSDTNVVVGIRGVNLTLDKGEFVAITGKSGSGKSTLLNILSGMDSYEEGELYINNEPTSHYIESDWEEYRKNYVSFIFQNYNIIESFTVLENVELSLMHIENKAERRKRALELIDRVGLSTHIKHKGSKLSGGQKQRTVIARALAKDSPIILADEPTGNLDSETSKEIIKLLYEISKDKLVVVVTHNFDEVEEFATRHIRIYDGNIESDHVIRESKIIEDIEDNSNIVNQSKKDHMKNGLHLGFTIFKAKPKLSTFICLLLLIATLGIFFITTICGKGFDIFDKTYMFTPAPGRVIISRNDSLAISNEELNNLVNKYEAKDAIHYDLLLDNNMYENAYYLYENYYLSLSRIQFTHNKDYGDKIIGSYPKEKNEVFLYLPIYHQKEFGKYKVEITDIIINSIKFKISGIKYYYDNNKEPVASFTQEGFNYATASYFLTNGNLSISVKSYKGEEYYSINKHTFISSFDMEENMIYINDNKFENFKDNANITITSRYQKFLNYYSKPKEYIFETELTSSNIQHDNPNIISNKAQYPGDTTIYIHPDIILNMANEALEKTYSQASLFFENNKIAKEKIESLKNDGYIVVLSTTTYQEGGEDAILKVVSNLALLMLWLLTIFFLAFFVNLCSFRSLNAFKEDMAIMRSMGIPSKVITISIYVRMLISLIPAFVIMLVSSLIIFLSPSLNGYFVYLYYWQYILIILGMLTLTLRITHKQIHKLFNESVKKALKGGN